MIFRFRKLSNCYFHQWTRIWIECQLPLMLMLLNCKLMNDYLKLNLKLIPNDVRSRLNLDGFFTKESDFLLTVSTFRVWGGDSVSTFRVCGEDSVLTFRTSAARDWPGRKWVPRWFFMLCCTCLSDTHGSMTKGVAFRDNTLITVKRKSVWCRGHWLQ